MVFLLQYIFFGILIGFLYISNISDRYGRVKTMIVNMGIFVVISLILLYNTNTVVLFIILFVDGIIYSGTSMCGFLLIFESTNSKNKTILSTVLSMSFGFGGLTNICLYYFFQNWITLVWINLILALVFIIFSFKIKESPEFLFNFKRYSELKETLIYISSINNRRRILISYLQKNTNIDMHIKLNQTSDCNMSPKVKIYGIYEIISLGYHNFTLLIMSINWFIMSLAFYGINFNINNFNLDVYLTGIVVYSSEMIAQLISMFLVFWVGDIKSAIFYYSLTGICLVMMMFFESKVLLLMFLLFFAKFGISAITNVNYIYNARLFPAHIRLGALSFVKIISRLGAGLSTILIELTTYSMLIIGMSCILSALLIYLYNVHFEGDKEEANKDQV